MCFGKPEQRRGRRQRPRRALRCVLLAAFLSALGPKCRAGDAERTNEIESGSLASLWDAAVLMPPREEGLLRGLALTGRLHYDYVNLDSNLGGEDFVEFRRLRSGFRAALPSRWELKAEVEFDPNEAEPFYDGLTDAYLAWRPADSLTFKMGKQPAFFTLEGATSSNELLTMERSNLANNLWFPQLFIPGVTVESKADGSLFFAGLYSSGGASPEFGDFEGSGFALLKAERDLEDQLGGDEAIVGLHGVFQDPDPDNTFTRPHGQVYSLNFRYREKPWRFQGDLARSRGSGDQPDLTGLVLMPAYDLDESWQLVARATMLRSDAPGGLRLARYENRITSERGDRFEEIYLGLNRYINGHKLKWQTGVSYAKLHDLATSGGDYEGWTCSSGIRLSW
jgi:phosphate-selective porin OprO/OprP